MVATGSTERKQKKLRVGARVQAKTNHSSLFCAGFSHLSLAHKYNAKRTNRSQKLKVLLQAPQIHQPTPPASTQYFCINLPCLLQASFLQPCPFWFNVLPQEAAGKSSLPCNTRCNMGLSWAPEGKGHNTDLQAGLP